MDIKELYNNLKTIDPNGNIILPKEYLKKFILMNILIMQEKRHIDQKEIFNYIKDNGFEIPGVWDNLDLSKQEKFFANANELLNLMKKF
mgnify:CR=1 FL=1